MRTGWNYLALAIVAVVLSGSTHVRSDELIGAVWEVHTKNPKTGKYQSFGLIRCTKDGKVFHDGKEVGTHKNIAVDKVEIETTHATNPLHNGVAKANKVAKNGTLWEGVFKRSDGVEIPMRMNLKKD